MVESIEGAYGSHRGRSRTYPFPGKPLTSVVTFTPPVLNEYAFRALAFQVVTAAGGGARQLILRILDPDGATLYGVAAPGTQAGGLTVEYSFAPLVVASGSSALGFQQAPLPGGRWPEHVGLSVTLSGNAAGDKITVGRLSVTQYEDLPY